MPEPRAAANFSKLFAKFLQIFRLCRQIFPKIPLAVFGDFKGLRALQARFAKLQVFCSGAGPASP